MILTESEKNDYLTLIAKREQMKKLDEECKVLSKRLIQLQKDAGELILETDEFKAAIVPTTKKTPQANIIEEKFSITLTDDCFKITTYDTLKVSKPKMVVEG